MTMKKILFTMLLVATLVLTLTSCGKFTCDLCGKEKSGKRYTEEVLGQEVTYCKECHDSLEDLLD